MGKKYCKNPEKKTTVCSWFLWNHVFILKFLDCKSKQLRSVRKHLLVSLIKLTLLFIMSLTLNPESYKSQCFQLFNCFEGEKPKEVKTCPFSIGRFADREGQRQRSMTFSPVVSVSQMGTHISLRFFYSQYFCLCI